MVSGRSLSLDQPRIMGVLNLTPDSFSDGGDLVTGSGRPDLEATIRRAEEMVEAGAAILDVGGESTRPGAAPVDPQEEIRRVVPVVEALAGRTGAVVSVDTRKAKVARAAIDAGAVIVNDVSALAFDPDMAAVVADSGAGCVLMHMRGTPADMRERARYADVTGEVRAELAAAAEGALEAGIAREAIVVDPGIGFAKTGDQSLRVVREIHRIGDLGYPILVGPSRKSFLGEILDVPPRDRVVGTAAVCVMAYLGGASIFRVHDVGPTMEAVRVAAAVRGDRTPGSAGA